MPRHPRIASSVPLGCAELLHLAVYPKEWFATRRVTQEAIVSTWGGFLLPMERIPGGFSGGSALAPNDEIVGMHKDVNEEHSMRRSGRDRTRVPRRRDWSAPREWRVATLPGVSQQTRACTRRSGQFRCPVPDRIERALHCGRSRSRPARAIGQTGTQMCRLNWRARTTRVFPGSAKTGRRQHTCQNKLRSKATRNRSAIPPSTPGSTGR